MGDNNKKNYEKTFLGLVIVATAAYFTYKYFSEKNEDGKMAVKLYREGKYKEALDSFRKVENKSRDEWIMMWECINKIEQKNDNQKSQKKHTTVGHTTVEDTNVEHTNVEHTTVEHTTVEDTTVENSNEEHINILNNIIHLCDSPQDNLLWKYVGERVKEWDKEFRRSQDEKYLSESFKDCFILTVSNGNMGDNRDDKEREEINRMANEKLVELTKIKTSKFKMKGKVSRIKIDDFYSEMPIFYDTDDLKGGGEKISEDSKKNGEEMSENKKIGGESKKFNTYDVIKKAGRYYVIGNVDRAVELLDRQDKSNLNVLFKSYFTNTLPPDINRILNEMSSSQNKKEYLTGLLLVSKIHARNNELNKAETYLLKAINNSGGEYDGMKNDLLILWIRKGVDKDRINKFIEEEMIRRGHNNYSWDQNREENSNKDKRTTNTSTKELFKDPLKNIYNLQINFLCISIEYCIKERNWSLVDSLYSTLSKFNDTRRFLFEHIIVSEINGLEVDVTELPNLMKIVVEDPSIYLDKAIELDPNYFKNYLFYGNYLGGVPRSIYYYKEALEHASTASEVYSAFHVLIVTEVQIEVLESKIGKMLLRL